MARYWNFTSQSVARITVNLEPTCIIMLLHGEATKKVTGLYEINVSICKMFFKMAATDGRRDRLYCLKLTYAVHL